jgi:hypothetical protein
MQWLKFERLIWEKGDPRSVRYHCEDCDTPIEEHHKTAMLAAGDPRAWLADVLARIADMPQQRLHELLPWNWKKQQNMAPSAA